MDKQAVLKLLSGKVEEIRKRFSAKTLSIFGSAARGEMANGSDVDILVASDQKQLLISL